MKRFSVICCCLGPRRLGPTEKSFQAVVLESVLTKGLKRSVADILC